MTLRRAHQTPATYRADLQTCTALWSTLRAVVPAPPEADWYGATDHGQAAITGPVYVDGVARGTITTGGRASGKTDRQRRMAGLRSDRIPRVIVPA